MFRYDERPLTMLTVAHAIDAPPHTFSQAVIDAPTLDDDEWELVVHAIRWHTRSLQRVCVVATPRDGKEPIAASRFVWPNMTNLVEVVFVDVYIDAIPFKYMPNVVKVRLDHSEWNHAPSFEADPTFTFVHKLPRVTDLTLEHVCFDKVSLECVPNVQRLKLGGLNYEYSNPNLSFSHFQAIHTLTHLTELTLTEFEYWAEVADTVVKHLIALMPRLRHLTIINCACFWPNEIEDKNSLISRFFDAALIERLDHVELLQCNLGQDYEKWIEQIKDRSILDYLDEAWDVRG